MYIFFKNGHIVYYEHVINTIYINMQRHLMAK